MHQQLITLATGLVNSDGEYRFSAVTNKLIRNTLSTNCRRVVVDVMELNSATMTWLLVSEKVTWDRLKTRQQHGLARRNNTVNVTRPDTRALCQIVEDEIVSFNERLKMLITDIAQSLQRMHI